MLLYDLSTACLQLLQVLLCGPPACQQLQLLLQPAVAAAAALAAGPSITAAANAGLLEYCRSILHDTAVTADELNLLVLLVV
jgi:hypothetical protein